MDVQPPALSSVPPDLFYSSSARALFSQQIDHLKTAAHAERVLWREFGKQKAACEFGDDESVSKGVDARVFSFEKEGIGLTEGGRRFLVTTYGQFWDRYIAMPENERHYYELIREGWPVHLYFDLEFQREHNPQADGDAMVDLLLRLVDREMRQLYGVGVTRGDVIDLGSSSAQKFSRHLIVLVPGCCFRNNAHAGNFVRLLVFHVEQQRHRDAELRRLFVVNDKGKETFFADLGVYTRNRNFRLWKSRKVGKPACFEIDAANRFPFSSERELFMKSLICNVDDDHQRRVLVCGEDQPAAKSVRAAYQAIAACSPGRNPLLSRESVLEGEYTASPFPAVDEFMLGQINRGGVQGGLRSWVYFEESKVIIYNISRNRYCENIGRAHKSNHVFYVVDLLKQHFYQKCHDPDCRLVDFKGVEHPVPAELCPPPPMPATADVVQQRILDDSSLLGEDDFAEGGRLTVEDKIMLDADLLPDDMLASLVIE